jgi:acetoin utilization deacetylase AcuC-like enzyme
LRIHGREYVERFLDGSLEAAAMRKIGFPWSIGLVRRTLASVGGTLEATRAALESGCGGTLAGGTHHAFRNEGSGFCVFNDLAVAIAWMREVKGVERVAVIDLDVHQGDGTAAIFRDDASVFTLSLHGGKNFPFRKQKSVLDVELEDGTGDAAYLEALEPALTQAWAFEPEAVFFQAGVDALATDRLGRLALSPAGLAARDRLVIESARARGLPLVITLGGGYSRPIELTVAAHARTFRTAAEIYGD